MFKLVYKILSKMLSAMVIAASAFLTLVVLFSAAFSTKKDKKAWQLV